LYVQDLWKSLFSASIEASFCSEVWFQFSERFQLFGMTRQNTFRKRVKNAVTIKGIQVRTE